MECQVEFEKFSSVRVSCIEFHPARLSLIFLGELKKTYGNSKEIRTTHLKINRQPTIFVLDNNYF